MMIPGHSLPEFDIDRTAFESTYYVAEYAREHPYAAAGAALVRQKQAGVVLSFKSKRFGGS
jgi:hypothetical protein